MLMPLDPRGRAIAAGPISRIRAPLANSIFTTLLDDGAAALA